MLKEITYPYVSCECERAIALGNFDGIHQGHLEVIKPIKERENLRKSLVTFTPHPQEFFTGQKKQLLTPIKEKKIILESLGIDELILLPFNRELANLTPKEFVEDVLKHKIKAKFITVGEDFCFGYQRQGKAEDLKNIAEKHNILVKIIYDQNLDINGEKQRISSSLIRNSLQEGKIELVNKMLGRKYQLEGKVMEGQKLGRELGFPTANLEINPDKYLPCDGVYFVEVGISEDKNFSQLGVMNIGKRPTVKGKSLSIEVHLLKWSGDLYGKTLTVKLLQFIRPEKHFSSLNELKKQITNDCQTALKLTTII